MSRIELTDNAKDIITKMSNGNPGALDCLCKMLMSSDAIDPQLSGLGNILLLDTLKIYGTDIYILYNDQCCRDLRRMMMLLRSWQLGFIDDTRLQEIAGCQTRENLLSEKEMDVLDDQLCERLPQFAKREITAVE